MSEKKIPIGPAYEKDTALPIKVVMRVYFSSYHLWAAEHFSKLAASRETAPGQVPRFDIEHRAFVTNCILSCVAFLEAAINELFQDAADGHMSYVGSLPPEAIKSLAGAWAQGVDRLGLLQKYQMACHLARLDHVDAGTEPFQSASQVVRIRNTLVHYKPESLSAEDSSSLERALSTRFPQNPLMAGAQGNPYFPDKCFGAGCAAWAVDAVTRFATTFFARLGIQPNFQRVNFSLSRVNSREDS
jgi:hypothetical protein